MKEAITRRQALQGFLAGCAGFALAACGSAPAAPGSSQVSGSAASVASPTGKPASGAAPAGAVATTWDDLLVAAKKEGKVTVSGPPDADSRAKLPPAFKDKFGIEMEYLGGNSSQLAARIESERAAGQYTMDASLSGSDSMIETFYKNKWLDPLKPSLLLPDAADGSKWRAGSPWFRDPDQTTIMQLFNTVQPMLTLNLGMVTAKDIPTSDALLDPKWKGKICAYDPSVNGAGLAIACAIYVAKGPDFATKLFKGQSVVLSRDYQQVADWVAQGSYPIAVPAQIEYLTKYMKAGVKIGQSGSADVPEFSDAPSAVGGGFGDMAIWNHAPHPNAARVFANWMASKEGLALYAPTQAAAPARNDIDTSSFVDDYRVPKPGAKYLDTYDYDFEVNQRVKIRDFYDKLLK